MAKFGSATKGQVLDGKGELYLLLQKPDKSWN
jgi:hypothetical protein